MHYSHAGLVALCSLTAAGACSGDADEVVIKNSAGTGGSSTQVGGTGGTGNIGGSIGGTGGSAGAEGSPVCEGPAPSPNPGNLREGQKCYISELTQGETECLPLNDSALLGRLEDYIASIGFVTQFVIDFAETVPLPASCEPLVECCSVRDENQQRECYDQLENPLSTTLVDGCPVRQAAFNERFACSGSSEPDAGQTQDAGGDAATTEQDDAGSQAAPSRSLCCYRVCGYDQHT